MPWRSVAIAVVRWRSIGDVSVVAHYDAGDVFAGDNRTVGTQPAPRLIPQQSRVGGRLGLALPLPDSQLPAGGTQVQPGGPALPRSRTSAVIVLFADLTALLCALLLADTRTVLILFVTAAVAWHILGLYSRRFTISILDDAVPIVVGLTCAVALLALVTRGDPAGQLVALTALSGGVILTRSVAYGVIRWRRSHGHEVFPALILGSGAVAATLIERMLEHPETGLRPVGWMHDEAGAVGNSAAVPQLGPARELNRAMTEHSVSDVIVCGREDLLFNLVDELRLWGRSETAVHAVPTLFELHHLDRATDEVWGVPLEVIRRPGSHLLARLTKRLIDITLSLLVLVPLVPLLALVALAVRLEVGPGILFRQERVGLEGRRFFLLKFRSIPDHARAEARWSVLDQGLIGPVGRFIRRYSLDEIPQLFNVLKGEMSLVGPRPERPAYVERFDQEIPGYRHRHRVPVGMTGLAVVKGLRGASSLRDRAYFDNLYIENWSVWLDVKILVRTVTSVVRGTGS